MVTGDALPGDIKQTETRGQVIERLGAIWSDVEKVQADPALMTLLDRQSVIADGTNPDGLLTANGYPARSRIEDLEMGEWDANLDPRFIKDGFIFLFRGDNPSQGAKGFYARTYGYGRKSTKELAAEISKPEEVGYVLYSDENYLNHPQAHVSTVAGELAWFQSAVGGSSFISATTNLETARAGTGNQPSADQQEATEIYVLKVPVGSVINSNTNNHFGLEEDEYLIPDFVSPTEVVARFPRDAKDEILSYMHGMLGVTREDIKIKDAA
jgi:hypothetical protein